MNTVFTKLTPRATAEAPIYMTRLQFTEAYYIPEEAIDRIIIVDFKEDKDNGTRPTYKNAGCSKTTTTSL